MNLHLQVLTPEAQSLAPRLLPHVARLGYTMAGGTALALQLGHRVSVDFDLFCDADPLPSGTQKLIQQFDDVQLLQNENDTYEAIVQRVKCSFFAYPYPFSAGDVAGFHNVPLASPADIGGMKLIAIAQRGARKDFVDLYTILRQCAFTELVTNLTARMPIKSLNPMHIAKSLTYFEDALKEPDVQWLDRPVDWPTIQRYFESNIRKFTNALVSGIR